MIFDILVLAVLLVSSLHAFWRGFIREILTIFGAIGGVLAALAFGETVRPTIESWMGMTEGSKDSKLFDVVPLSMVADFLTYGSVFIVVFGVLSFISYLISQQVRNLGLGAVDRTLGVVFGLVRGLVIVSIFYLPIHIFTDDDTRASWFHDSKTHVVVLGTSNILKQWMPTSFDEKPVKTGETDPNDPTKVVKDVIQQLGAGDITKPSDPAPSVTPDAPGYVPDDRKELDRLIEQSP